MSEPAETVRETAWSVLVSLLELCAHSKTAGEQSKQSSETCNQQEATQGHWVRFNSAEGSPPTRRVLRTRAIQRSRHSVRGQPCSVCVPSPVFVVLFISYVLLFHAGSDSSFRMFPRAPQGFPH